MRPLGFRLLLLLLALALTAASPVPAQQTAPSKPASAAKRRPAFRWVNPPKGSLAAGVWHRTFDSKIAGEPVGYVVALPPGYDEQPAKRYPVLYYLHGGRPGSELKSASLGPMMRALMTDGAIAPMIVVFPNGGPVSHYDTPAEDDINQDQTQGATVFLTELIPHIDATFRTQAERSGRHLMGFSQGGRGTARLALRHPELFATAAPGGGGFATEKRISESDGYEHPRLRFAPGDNAYDLAKRYAERRAAGDAPDLPLLFWVGTKGFNYENNLAYMAMLDELGVPYEKIIVPGVKHNGRELFERRGADLMRFHQGD